jgi:Polyphosphate kinase 2 (PPK2)
MVRKFRLLADSVEQVRQQSSWIERVSPKSPCSRSVWTLTRSERELWPKYVDAYEDAMALTSTKRAPWYIIPSNHKWFRNLAVSQIIADTMNEMGLKLPPTHVDIAGIRRKYHAAKREEKGGKRRTKDAKKG